MRSGLVCVITAVSAVSLTGIAQAQNLRWDADGPSANNGVDGGGTWDLSTPTWFDLSDNTNKVWQQGATAIFGDPANSAAAAATPGVNGVAVSANITVGDLIFNRTADGGIYNLTDGGGSLTLQGNIYENSGIGQPNNSGQVHLDLFSTPLILDTGNHSIALRDSPGDWAEMTVNANMSGAGGITVDNQLAQAGAIEAWGTVVFNGVNSYTGATNINFGRLVITQNSGLGDTSAGTTISNAGTLSIGANQVTASNVTISEPILITRNTYGTGEFGRYNGAIVSYNGSGTTTFNGPFVIDSTEARVRAQTSTLVIASNITTGANTASVLGIDGDTAGFVHLTGNNTALATGGIKLVGGELIVDNDNQIGGASAPISFSGGYIRFVGGYLTNFGSHPINGATGNDIANVNGGVDVDAGTTFTVNQNLAGSSFAMRGDGTLNLGGTNVLTGANFYDGGIVNVSGSHSIGGLRMRRSTMNVLSGATLTTSNTFTSIGVDRNDTNQENSTLNILSGAHLVGANADFNVADNGNTVGKLTIQGTATADIAGSFEIGKNGTSTDINNNKPAMGTVEMSGATLNVGGEFWVGNNNGVGVYTQTNGEVTLKNWLAIGRQGDAGGAAISKGTFDISAGKFSRVAGVNTGSHNYVGEGSGKFSTMTVHGTAEVAFNAGQFWVANGGTSAGTLTIADTAKFSVNSWLAVGRNGTANGTIILKDNASLTKTSGSGDTDSRLTIGSGNTATGLLTQTGNSTLTADRTFIGENGTGVADIQGGTASFGLLGISDNGAGNGTLKISGTAKVSAGATTMGRVGTGPSKIELSGGSLTTDTLVPGTSTGAKTFNWTGGQFGTGTYSLAIDLNNTGTTTVLAPRGSGAAANVGAMTMTTGNYTQGATGQMTIELASASSNDSLVLSGSGTTATLGGTLNLSRLAGYVPELYTPVTIVSAPSVIGTFKTITGVQASSTRGLAVTYDGTSVKVQAAEFGDTNFNGTVNFNDLVTLASNYNKTGKTWVDGDFNGDGTVGFTDLVSLAQFYNHPATLQADWAYALSITPEPASLMALGLLGVAGIRRRK